MMFACIVNVARALLPVPPPGGFRGVEEFPFTGAEWDGVNEAALPLINATFAEDDALRASCLIELREVLGELRARHGDHPVLLETEADFAEDDAERVALYRRAAGIAAAHRLPTLGIRLSLAQVLLGTGEPGAALAELLACESELVGGEEPERASWAKLAAAARQAESSAASDPGR
jgi:hypothetical protein